jgi:hypothetical protein
MKSFTILVFVACAWSMGGCTPLEADKEGQSVRTEPVYVTGSNIAKRRNAGEVSVMSREGYEQTRMPPPVPTMPGGGH